MRVARLSVLICVHALFHAETALERWPSQSTLRARFDVDGIVISSAKRGIELRESRSDGLAAENRGKRES